jgi:N-acetylmuramoyl-L-alanine amidase/Mannosyl-glycoprotein endo-beta-N-acetylglucosaminidase
LSFANLNIRIDSPAALAAWLRTQPRPAWSPIGATYHNTYKPTLAQWRGAASMQAMARHYESLGWSTGPHLFLALGTSDDGIWVMTPPSAPGTHAGPCNARRFGIEVVGDYGATPMSDAQVALLGDCAAELLRWAGAQSPDIVAHRDCMPGRTCPGDAAYKQKAAIQARLAANLSPRPEHYTDASLLMSRTDAPALAVAERMTPREGHRYTPREIRDIVTRYYALCTPVGLNPLLTIAQMAHETGYLTSWWCDRIPGAPGRRNPAGIGVNGQTRPASDPHPMPPELWHLDAPAGLWRRGYVFANWQQAITAHVGRLLAYATQPDARAPAQQALILEATERRPLPIDIHGSSPILRTLGSAHNPTGLGWAHPGTHYGAAIARIGNELGAT